MYTKTFSILKFDHFFVMLSNGMQAVTALIPMVYYVSYEPGMISAIGYDDNKDMIDKYSVSTSNEPYAIELIIEYPGNII